MSCLLQGSCQREPESRKIEMPSYNKAFEIHWQTIVFFSLIRTKLLSQKKTMTKHLTILEKALKAPYEVAYLIAKDKKPHSIGETLIIPAAIAIS